MIETLDCDDADVILVTLGSAAGLVRSVVWQLRDQGVRAGMRIRYLRPMPSALIAEALRGARLWECWRRTCRSAPRAPCSRM